MALVSALSLRISNPGCCIVVLCDELSAEGLRSNKHRLLDQCDRLVSIKTPLGEPTYKNRWIKTQAIKFAPAPCLLLDTDTLVRGTLAELAPQVEHVGVVANHNSLIPSGQLYAEDIAELRKMEWPEPDAFKPYANGGFLFFQNTSEVAGWYELYHRLWLHGCKRTGRTRDQPALNTSLKMSGVRLTELQAKYNLQINVAKEGVDKALVWHFYSSTPGMGKIYSDILRLVNKSDLKTLQSAVRAAINITNPQCPLWIARGSQLAGKVLRLAKRPYMFNAKRALVESQRRPAAHVP